MHLFTNFREQIERVPRFCDCDQNSRHIILTPQKDFVNSCWKRGIYIERTTYVAKNSNPCSNLGENSSTPKLDHVVSLPFRSQTPIAQTTAPSKLSWYLVFVSGSSCTESLGLIGVHPSSNGRTSNITQSSAAMPHFSNLIKFGKKEVYLCVHQPLPSHL